MKPQPRRVLARWMRRVARGSAFRQFVDSRKFRNPDTDNDVQFDSLPREEQVRILQQWRDKDKEPEKKRRSPRGVIPVDKKMARAKAKEWADQLADLKYRDRDTSLWMNRAQPWPLDMGHITIRDVKGQEHRLAVKVSIGEPPEDGWKSGRSFVNKGTATHGHYESEPHEHGFPMKVEIELNHDKSPAQLSEGKSRLEDEIYNVLIHELTHAQDLDESLAQKQKRRKKHDDKDPKVYYNLPHEVRAFKQQVTDEIEKALESLYGKPEESEDSWIPDESDLLQGTLDRSHTWERVKRHMSPENRKKVLQSAYSAVAEFAKAHRSKKVARAWLARHA